MTSTPHVSRWQLCQPVATPVSSAHSSSSLPTVSEAIGKVSPSAPPVSLRYLDEFVGKLHCASALLQYELFPDAKEITESMALFNTVRRYIEPGDCEKDVNAEPGSKHDGIVVVGDGNTPRTAALFAFRMRGWTCYSVDPAMEKETSERSKRWTEITNLVVVRNKVENVRIALRRAIVVLVHAHVTLDQALSAIQAEQICGVVTLPCCNWYGQQESLFGRGPDLVYDDFSVLSNHREIRLWIGDGSASNGRSAKASRAHSELVSGVMKGCVRKELTAGKQGIRRSGAINDEDAEKQAKILAKKHDGVLDLIGDTLAELTGDPPPLNREESLPDMQVVGGMSSITLASCLRRDTGVLVLCWRPRRAAVRSLLGDGYTNVYTISLAEEKSVRVTDNGRRGLNSLKLQLHKCTIDADVDPGTEEVRDGGRLQLTCCGCFTLESSFALHCDEECNSQKKEEITVAFDGADFPAPPLSCIVDAGFVYRGFRGRSKKNPIFFRRIYRTLDHILAACGHITNNRTSPSLVCLTPRKRWHKKEFLAHEYEVLSLVAKEPREGTPLYAYCCFKRHAVSPMVPCLTTESSSKCTSARDTALEIWTELEQKLVARKAELDDKLIGIDSPDARTQAASAQERADAEALDTLAGFGKVYAQATGEITRVRRFSNGTAFVSLVLTGSRCDRPLQLFLQHETLGFSIPKFVKVASLLRKGDELIAVGFLARNARGHSMLQVEALSLARSGEFEAYN
ncbi:unnamed protein product [Hyaloperonospora brassicae]|uniref:Methyltransferase domain-containing protein n=1 Tax=Hyaloperonospora brassicae TaxID=162125 RepID=A0AAV0TVX0_HYABA|nr:unnamed protein product [Hyaloperonospora brassicae]